MADPTVCHIPPVQPKTQPETTNLPSIPLATPDLGSLVNSVNQMRQVIMLLTGQRGAQGPRGPAGKDGAKASKAQWVEQSRTTSKVKVYQNNDPTTGNFVEVERINSLTMADKATGQTWKWTR